MSNPNLEAAVAAISAAQDDFTGEESQIASLSDQNAALTAQVADLLKQLAAGKQGSGLLSPLITQFRNIESMPGWIWPKGTQGNTGGVGNTGIATWQYDPATGIVTAGITPTLPKVAGANNANYNAYFFNPLAGTDSNTGKPLPFPAIAPILNTFVYHAEYFVPSSSWAARNALENEIRWHNGQGWRHIMASQLRIGSSKPTVHIYDWEGAPDKWVDTGVPCNMTPDAWYAIDTVFRVDPVGGNTTCVGFFLEGKWHPVNHTQTPNKYTNKAWFLASVQPDSNTAGAPFSYQPKNLHVTIL